MSALEWTGHRRAECRLPAIRTGRTAGPSHAAELPIATARARRSWLPLRPDALATGGGVLAEFGTSPPPIWPTRHRASSISARGHANPISVFRAASQQVSDTLSSISHESRTTEPHSQTVWKYSADAEFPSVVVKSFSCSKPMTIDEASRFLLLTYLPICPPGRFAQLTRVLEAELAELDRGTGTVTFVEHPDLVTATVADLARLNLESLQL